MSDSERSLPRIGARIRITRTHPAGVTNAIEGTVVALGSDSHGPYVDFGILSLWTLTADDRTPWTTTWEVLADAPD